VVRGSAKADGGVGVVSFRSAPSSIISCLLVWTAMKGTFSAFLRFEAFFCVESVIYFTDIRRVFRLSRAKLKGHARNVVFNRTCLAHSAVDAALRPKQVLLSQYSPLLDHHLLHPALPFCHDLKQINSTRDSTNVDRKRGYTCHVVYRPMRH
jgi:hypothetical protein